MIKVMQRLVVQYFRGSLEEGLHNYFYKDSDVFLFLEAESACESGADDYMDWMRV